MQITKMKFELQLRFTKFFIISNEEQSSRSVTKATSMFLNPRREARHEAIIDDLT